MIEAAAHGLIPEKRSLTRKERELSKWLLEHRNVDSSKLLAQIDKLTVVSKCNCGCPTVYLAVDGQEPSRERLRSYLRTT
jgi:hypothetical protein